MFEDFKYEVCRLNSEKAKQKSLPPEVVAKLQSQGLDPETVTMKQLFPEVLNEGGSDISLMSGAEWKIMITYAKTRKYLLEKYPQSQEEAKMLGQPWDEKPNEPYQINVATAREDPRAEFSVRRFSKCTRFMKKSKSCRPKPQKILQNPTSILRSPT